MNGSDTIYALASGHGKAGVAVFRISGKDALGVLRELGVARLPAPRAATLVKLTTPGGVTVDRALALTFPAPHSFTGEDVLELHTHGSRAVSMLLLDALSKISNLRLAEPGEFARRAFLNQKFDLLEAEGLADLIDAETPAQHAQAMRQMEGEISHKVSALREKILTPLALLEAYIDFPDEEIPEETLAEVQTLVTSLTTEIQNLLDDGGIGEKIRDGIEIVIFGPPNAGKSSLLNAIAKRDVAIVSEEAGTTRDMIEVHLNLDGYAVTLIDTAGLREATGTIEAEGIRRAHHRMENAALKIAVLDIVTASESYRQIQTLIDERTLVILNKSDLASTPHSVLFDTHISSTTGENFDRFFALLKERVAALVEDRPSPLITRARHRDAFTHALAALNRFDTKCPLELMCEELRVAAQQIGKITGKITTDDLLDVVFSRFCIGK
jgi:tRNA modification GTPase